MRAITVYCSSSKHVPHIYFDAARELGEAIGKQGWNLVYGGNCVGCMDAVACAVRSAGGRVIGITPQIMVDQGIHDTSASELHVTANMRERKHMMEQRGDAFIALPGGLGTLEEVFEIIVGRQLGYHTKPIVILNVANFYDPLLAMIEHGIEHRFIRAASRELFFVAADVHSAIEHIRRNG